MNADFHLHSSFSGDSSTPARDIIQAGIRRGISRLCITDHLDLDYPYDNLCFDLNTEQYFSELTVLQRSFSPEADIQIGVELGLQPHLGERYGSYTKSFPFDFIIGSTHLVDKIDIYYPVYWESHDCRSGIRRFFDVTLENIRSFDDFDVYGHLDYVIRYVPKKENLFSYSDYADQIDTILKLLLEKGKGIEVNTGGYRAGLGVPNPCPAILSRYRELGGEIITMGSDAHTADQVGFCLEKAKDILRSCGFGYFTVFRERKPEFIPL